MDLLVTHPRMALLGAIAIAALVYWWHINHHPWVPCGWCKGGNVRHLSLRPFGDCPRCGGRGKRLRFASRLLGRDKTTGGRKR